MVDGGGGGGGVNVYAADKREQWQEQVSADSARGTIHPADTSRTEGLWRAGLGVLHEEACAR